MARDLTKYNFNGKTNLAKNKLVLEVVKKYIKENLDLTYSKLKEVFSDEIQGSIGVIKNEKELLSWEKGNSESNLREKRFFTKEKDILKLENENIYVCTEWGVDNIPKLKKKVEQNLNYKIDENVLDYYELFEKEEVGFFKSKNIMLYGAPGVGKTHNYKKLISMIENGNSEQDIFKSITTNQNTADEYNDIFQNIKDEKRIEFVTFHQSYSYEDFIEGFRPNENGNIKLEDGIFKEIVQLAITNIKESEKDINTIKNEKTFSELFELYKDYIQEEIDSNQKFIINNTAYITNIEKDAFRYTGDSWGNTQRMKFSDIELMNKLNILERKDIKKSEGLSGLANQHATYFSYLMKSFNSFQKNHKIKIDEVSRVERKNFYIVIDEINRGNISKIFGELITLIEEDKRDDYEVTLPYSKEKFKIPSNLFIIATMNSTDKSIATIDIALRRRFTFLKMKPNEDLVNYPDAKEIMSNLNTFIKAILGEDYMLGHSYFMKVTNTEDLEFIKEYKIKPLLEEYFYADDDNYKKVIKLLEKDENE